MGMGFDFLRFVLRTPAEPPLDALSSQREARMEAAVDSLAVLRLPSFCPTLKMESIRPGLRSLNNPVWLCSISCCSPCTT